MSPWQIARQIRYRLEQVSWADSPTETVFPAVKIIAGNVGIGTAAGYRFPFAIVRPLDATMDEDEPDILLHDFEVIIVQAVAGDDGGQRVIIGGNRSSEGSSLGRGIMELEEVVGAELFDEVQGSGIKMRLTGQSEIAAAEVDGIGYAAARSLRIQAWCNRTRHYHPVTRFTATDATGGDTSLAWTIHPDRWDRYNVVVRRASGATAPASATAGTGVTLAGLLSTSVTDSPGAGQFSYAVFAGYDETGDSSADRYSAAATATVTVT